MGKVLIIYPGEQVSFHFHYFKEETMYVWDGVIEVHHDCDGKKKTALMAGSIFHVNPGLEHSMKCVSVKLAVLFEASTPFPEDSIRIKDYYNG